ncbi:glycerol kinase [Yoonia rosea]|uniref:Glycerol kinase n=1 Tax=Yoonia rosea TaxID=287098 RepID=A0A1R3X9I4_9RHOB|nr:glycerol kinase [Yoonia rosea]
MRLTYILAIDQGTTSTRATVFDATMGVLASTQEEFTQHFPQSGWVEHDPEDLWKTTVGTCGMAIARSGISPSQIAGIGITNQQEFAASWVRETQFQLQMDDAQRNAKYAVWKKVAHATMSF